MAKFSESEFYEQEVIIGMGDSGIKTEKMKKEEARNRLIYTREAQSGPDCVLTGRVVGVTSTKYYVAAILAYNGYKIMIEDKEFLDFPEFKPEQYPYANEKQLHEVILNSCIGAEVDFCLLPKQTRKVINPDTKKEEEMTFDTMDDEHGVAWCSRKRAMVRRYREKWCKHRDGKRHITEGRALVARIVRVARTTVFFESYGVEFKVPLEELTWSRMEDARLYFKPGQKDYVRILKIDYAENEDTTKPTVVASRKQMRENPVDVWCRMVNEGEIYLAKISAQHGKSFYVRILSDSKELNGAVVMCSAALNLNRYPQSGDECTISIKLIDANKRRIFGKIIDLSPREELLY